jgi:beta-lactamase superfamily II metal-dependent hydrolase
MANSVNVSIKMFQVGELGDCFWLQFEEGKNKSNVLIDCGSFRNSDKSKKRLREIVSYMRDELGERKFDVVVGTHQHNDHLSGYVHCEDLFEGLVVQSWLSWLDDPKDGLARKVKKDEKALVNNVRNIRDRLTEFAMREERMVLSDILGFYSAQGDEPEVPAKGVEVLKKIGEKDVRYLSPGEIFSLPGLGRDAVKVYVLGPPRNQSLLFDKDPSKGESYDPHLALANANAERFLSAIQNYTHGKEDKWEGQFPFSSIYKKKGKKADEEIFRRYNHRGENWRKIDNDWLETASRLALYLDSYTNNSSLVLAFELVKSGKFLLFAADAQTGNWLSWDQIKWKKPGVAVGVQDILQNTVLYKVGHHGSHNATLVKGLEAMEHPELVAMIPVDISDPNIKKENGWKMPAKNLYKRLKEKTNFRVLRMDQGFADGCDPKRNRQVAKWSDLKNMPKIDKDNGFIEYKVEG